MKSKPDDDAARVDRLVRQTAADDWDWEDCDDSEPVGSCDGCGCDVYCWEDDGSGLCDQCQWAAEWGV